MRNWSSIRLAYLATVLGLFAANAVCQTTASETGVAVFRIAGVVVSKADSRPLARARVALIDVHTPRNIRSLVTGENGQFAFEGLPAGKYSLDGAKRGYVPGAYDQHGPYSTAIVTGPELGAEHLVLRLSPDAYLFGRVLDENGDAARRANVTLYTINREQGFSRIVPNRGASTNDLGAYEFGPLVEGTYFVGVTAEPWYAVHPAKNSSPSPASGSMTKVDPSFDVAYPMTYYQDTTDPEEATPVQLHSGDRVQLDIHLQPVPSLHLLVRVPANPKSNYFVPELIQPGLGGEDTHVSARPTMVAPGLWELAGVPPGRYSINMIGGGRGPNAHLDDIDITAQTSQVDMSAAAGLSTVKASVQVAGENAVPTGLSVGLRTPHGNLKSWSTADAKGVAQIEGVVPGRYEIVAWNPQRRYIVTPVSAQGAQVSGHTIEVGAGSAVTLAVTLLSGTGIVEGVVKRDGKPLAGVMVVLVPNDRANTDLIRRDQSDFDGSFAVSGVVNGTYTLLAIEDGWDLEWSRPEVIARYLKQGKIVQVHGRTLRVDDAIEAQRR